MEDAYSVIRPVRKLALTEFRGIGPLARYTTPTCVVGQKYACAAQKKVLIDSQAEFRPLL